MGQHAHRKYNYDRIAVSFNQVPLGQNRSAKSTSSQFASQKACGWQHLMLFRIKSGKLASEQPFTNNDCWNLHG